MKYEVFNKQVEALNRKLEYYLLNVDQKKFKNDTKHLLNDENFLRIVSDARHKLGFEDEWLDYEPGLNDWVVETLAKRTLDSISDKDYATYLEKFQRTALQATEAANLPDGWQHYVETYIALGIAPSMTVIEPEMLIRVVDIEEDYETLTIELRRGLSSEDYRSAWKAFKAFLGQPSGGKLYADKLKNRIYLDRESGLSYKELAKKYYPEEYSRDLDNKTDYARDKVKKIVSRFKKINNDGDKD